MALIMFINNEKVYQGEVKFIVTFLIKFSY